MPITAKKHTNAYDTNIVLHRMIMDFDAQVYIFQGNDIEKTYEPTAGEWNYVKNGIESKLNAIPSLTNVVIDAYDPLKHLTPGTWH